MTFYLGIYDVFYRISQACRPQEGRKLPQRSGDVGNGPDTATDDGHEEVKQSDTVSIPAGVPGQPIPSRVIACVDPTLYAAPVSTLSQSDS